MSSTAPHAFEAAQALCAVPARHRAIDCESCDGKGYFGGPPFGRDQEVCKGCDGTGGKVVRCDGESVSVAPGIWYPAGCALPSDARKLAEGLRGDAHDANGNDHTDARNALLLAADAVEHVARLEQRKHEDAVKHLAEQLEVERQRVELLSATLRLEQQARATLEQTGRDLVEANAELRVELEAERERFNAELQAMSVHVDQVEEAARKVS